MFNHFLNSSKELDGQDGREGRDNSEANAYHASFLDSITWACAHACGTYTNREKKDFLQKYHLDTEQSEWSSNPQVPLKYQNSKLGEWLSS